MQLSFEAVKISIILKRAFSLDSELRREGSNPIHTT